MIWNAWHAIVFAVLGCAASLAGPALAQSPADHQHSFGDARKWAQVFDDPARDAWKSRMK